MGEPIDMESIVRVVDEVHPPAIVCARAGRPTVICDGIEGLLLIEGTEGWQWQKDLTTHPLHDLEELRRLLDAMAASYELEPQSRRAQAEQYVDAQRVRWIRDAEASPPPRLWGLCAPGRPRGASGPRLVLYDAQRPITSDRISAEAARLHPAAHVCFGSSWPTLVHDGVSWLMFFDWWDGWRWSLDGEDQGLVQDYLALQVILVEVAEVYAALDDGQRRRAAAFVEELSRVPLAERYRRAKEHVRRRGTLERVVPGLGGPLVAPRASSEGRG